MVNKHASFIEDDNKEYDPLDSYGNTSDAESHSVKEQLVKSSDSIGILENKQQQSIKEEKDPWNSWEENDSDDEPYPADAYDYGRDDEDDDDDDDEYEYEERPRQPMQDTDIPHKDMVNGHYTIKKGSFDQESDNDMDDKIDQKPPNSGLFQTSATDPRASVNSARSYSSHTKHHSFGYDKDRPEPSESESEDNSESESDDAFVNAPSSPSTVPKSLGSASNTHAASAAAQPTSHPGSPTLDRSSGSTATSLKSKIKENEEEHKELPLRAGEPAGISVASKSPVSSKPEPSSPINNKNPPAGPLSRSTPSPPLPTSDLTPRPPSDSGSDTSNSPYHNRIRSINGHAKPNQRPETLQRTLSSTSSSRGLTNDRSSSYSDISDAELNDVSLDEPSSHQGPKRSSGGTVAAPRVPVAASSAGFPSSFFGGRPHPKSQQFQHQQHPPQTSVPSPVSSTVADSRTGTIRQNSISSIASTIQGAFMGRGFGGSSSTALPPPPQPIQRSPSMSSQRGSNAGMTVNTGIDLRSSRNISPERASTYSTMTTDSNMDLLLARLEAQNSIVEQDTKKRSTSDSEMDRALGHAKEESTGEDVDWDYWGSLMHDYNGVVKKNPKQLTQMIQKGIPPALRGVIWQLLAKSKDGQLEASYAELLKDTSSHEKQIQRDMSRTFPNHEYFQAEGLGQESLFNVVKAYSLYDTEVGYCQGLSFVVGPLLLNMPDEEAFCVLVRMMSSYEMRGHYTPDMNMLQLRLYQFEQLMEETVPLIFKHFQNQGIRSTMYASQWFMTLFAYKFPLDLVFRVYDILFVEGIESLLRFAIALLKANHDKILNHDFETLIEFLKNGLFEPYMNNPCLFVQDAYRVKVTPKKLSQYAQKYTAMVQRQQAELAAEESLRESNRQLSAHVRRLEGSLHTLNKEHVDLAKELIARKMEMAQLQDQNDVLMQKVSDLTKIVDSQAKEVEDRLRDEIQSVMQKNVELIRQNEKAEDQCTHLESLLIDTKMKYAESENERDALTRKLNDLRKALGVA
ncbi:GTPase-activating protein [Haplosporangium sp. Z 11]|nr:GTPase-activating protein [Haplosporangium sp. Z 11]